jgi:hypothetical protein
LSTSPPHRPDEGLKPAVPQKKAANFSIASAGVRKHDFVQAVPHTDKTCKRKDLSPGSHRKRDLFSEPDKQTPSFALRSDKAPRQNRRMRKNFKAVTFEQKSQLWLKPIADAVPRELLNHRSVRVEKLGIA